MKMFNGTSKYYATNCLNGRHSYNFFSHSKYTLRIYLISSTKLHTYDFIIDNFNYIKNL